MSIHDRKGKFHIKFDMIRQSPMAVQVIMGKCIVLRAEALLMYKSIEYEALSQMFDEIGEAEEMPSYDIFCKDDLNPDKRIVFAKRVDTGNPARLSRKLNVAG